MTDGQSINYTFSGPFPGRKDPRTRTKGIMRARRAKKRKEAEARNAATPVELTKRFRLHPDSEIGDMERATGENNGMS